MIRVLLLSLVVASLSALGADHGVILLYHHVSDDTPVSTSVTPEQFDRHLEFIEENNFEVIPLTDMLDSIYQSGSVADNAVSITFDDAYLSVYTQAFPKLKARKWPFTVFVADQPVDKKYRNFMSWAQMRDMAEAGVDFGGHSVTHSHLVRRLTDESAGGWRQRVRAEILDNVARLEQQLNYKVRAFAYPYGEFNDELATMVSAAGYYGLGQHSGALWSDTPAAVIPRYPMNRSLAKIERLAVALNSRPLPVKNLHAGPMIRDYGDQRGVMKFNLEEGAFRRELINCFSASGEKLESQWKGDTFVVPLPKFVPGRNKINCTAPSSQKTGEFYWFSNQWLVRTADGGWPAE